ncbi:hypothetical protein SERLA73DRAFT_187417 [Serpula lacrymans var. lacrymans S7.3]|uniref:Uncharacterized protein n=2 Tax=Serpula lacrymans var. lacrymans TaxID=341189 RepID=F8Q951_SERL3|nr:uncharacterized protein SERLADRAFT_476943 [Serpula lacrymans var. lacrymans S7.9]EGN95106.1 hypothetical protein SERLA73DRAFT_187417 [Serpula lacrymans var. lacrymans S7.3]EGO20593.1 hypothetical protein SERLADRAFT_476943 [Serpula lacrymans var. lacrymans S7.9]
MPAVFTAGRSMLSTILAFISSSSHIDMGLRAIHDDHDSGRRPLARSQCECKLRKTNVFIPISSGVTIAMPSPVCMSCPKKVQHSEKEKESLCFPKLVVDITQSKSRKMPSQKSEILPESLRTRTWRRISQTAKASLAPPVFSTEEVTSLEMRSLSNAGYASLPQTPSTANLQQCLH